MSMEIHVFFRGTMPGAAALTRAMKELGFPLSIPAAVGSLEQQRGFVPMRLWREESGVEIHVSEDRAEIEALFGGDAEPGIDRVASFRWSSDEREMVAAICASAALAKLKNGIVVHEADDRRFDPDGAVNMAREYVAEDAARQQHQRAGTRPADIKRYLRPLLKQRDDLVLIGRMLLIRPVRHVLRGVLLEPGSDRYSFRVRPYIKTLYGGEGGLGFCEPVHESHWQVWQPHFEALLMDALAEDIFARVGRITTLADVATTELSDPDRFFSERVTALALAGEHGRAEDYIRESEQKNPDWWKDWADTQREFLARDIAAVCAEFRANEVETVKALKLEKIWEPSPFPVELPAAERVIRSSEPLFLPTPWIDRPPWLLQDPPDRPGDVRFAKDQLHRNGGIVLLVPLTRKEAEARHRNGESYVLAQRLERGVLMRLRHLATWDRRDPRYLEMRKILDRAVGREQGELSLPVRIDTILLELQGSNAFAQLSFHADRHEGPLLNLLFVTVRQRSERWRNWHSNVDLKEGEVGIHDDREPRNRTYTRRPLTDAERELVTAPMPEFGEVDGLVTRALGWLRSAGYGEIT